MEVGNGIYIIHGNLDAASSTGSNTGKSTSGKHNSSSHSSSSDHKNSGTSSHNSGSSTQNNSHPDYTVPARGERNYLTNNINHVKQLVLEKINAARSKEHLTINVSLANEYCKPYATNSEIQALADLRADEAARYFSHTRPNGERMDSNEYDKLLPRTNAALYGGASDYGETLSGVYAEETDEESAEDIFQQIMGEKYHREVLMSTNSRVGYAAVGLHFDKKKGYCVAFEMAGNYYYAKMGKDGYEEKTNTPQQF